MGETKTKPIIRKSSTTYLDVEFKSKASKKIENLNEIFHNRGLKAINPEYIKNVRNKVDAIDSEGYLYFCSINNIRTSNPYRFASSNPHTIKNIELYIKKENKGYTLLSNKFINGREKNLLIECPSGHTYNTSWQLYQSGSRCPHCAGRTRTTESFRRELVDLIGQDYELKTDFIKTDVKVTILHKICNQTYETIPAIIIHQKSGCSHCFKRRLKTHEDFVKEVFDVSGSEYIVSGKYKSSQEHVEMYHSLCEKKYGVLPNHFLGGTRCPHCASNASIDTREFKKRVFLLTEDEYSVDGEYVNRDTKIKITHNLCKKQFEMHPTNFTSAGQRCPHCKKSKGEKIVVSHLDKNTIPYSTQKRYSGCKNKKTLPFDFLILNSLILEYDGEDHFYAIDRVGKGEGWALENYKYRNINDKIKNQYCIDNNIPLLRIPYWEQSNIEPILNTALMHFGIIPEDDSYDYTLIKEWLVDSSWDHDAYIAKCPKNKKEAAKILTNSY